MDGETCIDCLPEIKKCEGNIHNLFMIRWFGGRTQGRILEKRQAKKGYLQMPK
jgi:hypothetical protein